MRAAGIGAAGQIATGWDVPRAVGWWLIACAALVFAMVVLGGVTRLTHSGLSMVEWRPVTGWLPPFSEAAWEQAFAAYRQFPEYQKINAGMSLGEFKGIFWFEFLHRLLGRTVGVAFLVPFLAFLFLRKLPAALAWRLAGLFVLGGLQGGVGWWMVKSGLVDHPDVSHYRLAIHLGLAVIIYGLLLATAFAVLWPQGPDAAARRRGLVALLAAAFVVILSGALVAGLDAGFAYNTFPTMNGAWLPAGMWTLDPWYANLLENTTTVQFIHRWLASATAAAIAIYWWRYRREVSPGASRAAFDAAIAAVAVQVALGISTLVLVVPVPLAAAHQAGALVVFAALIAAIHLNRTGARA
jgi:cytochrome c oxidase assembly protein subunit 15